MPCDQTTKFGQPAQQVQITRQPTRQQLTQLTAVVYTNSLERISAIFE